MQDRPRKKTETAHLSEQLAALVGPGGAITDPRDLEPHLREWRGRWFGRTPMLLRPATVAEVSAILRFADEHGLAVVPQGGNTGLAGGQIPSAAGDELLLSLSRLNRIRAVDPRGNTMTVEAGVTLQAAQDAAADAGRSFPLSLASQGSCTIGGVLATNAGGIHVLRYGSARDLTLGIEAVLADGRIWNGLRTLRKDNTGYDLKNLIVGSEGTLAVITAAVLKLVPRPAETAAAFAGLPSLEGAGALFERAQRLGGGLLSAFELLPRIGVELILRHVAGARDPLNNAHPWYALFDVDVPLPDGSARRIAETILSEAVDGGEVADAVIAASEAQARELWRLREEMSEVQSREGGSIKHDISVAVPDIPRFIEEASAVVERLVPGARPVPFGHYGDGNIHFNISQPEGADRQAFLARWDEVSAAVHEVVLRLGGSISAEHGIGQMKVGLLPQVKSPVEMDMMRAVKRGLDPKGILNPGKVLARDPATGV